MLINQLIEKAMREETEQQKAKLDDIKRRVTMIRELNEIRKRGVSTPHTYEQCWSFICAFFGIRRDF